MSDDCLNVLMVDDDANIRRIVAMSLKRLTKWQVRVVGDATEVFDAVSAERPDVILLDMMMPGMDGMAVLAEMKSRMGNNMPKVIVMTAKVQAHEVGSYDDAGIAGVISKPFDPMKLPEQIRKIVVNSSSEANSGDSQQSSC